MSSQLSSLMSVGVASKVCKTQSDLFETRVLMVFVLRSSLSHTLIE